MGAVARDLGYPPVSREVYTAGWGQSVEDDARMFCPAHTAEEVERLLVTRFREHAAHLRVDPAAAPLLERLRARGVRSAVVEWLQAMAGAR